MEEEGEEKREGKVGGGPGSQALWVCLSLRGCLGGYYERMR